MEQVVSIPSAQAGLEMKGRGADGCARLARRYRLIKPLVSLSESTVAEIGAIWLFSAIPGFCFQVVRRSGGEITSQKKSEWSSSS